MLVVTSTSQPSDGSRLQSAKPGAQLVMLQLPPLQKALAWFLLQFTLHAPHVSTPVRRLASQPLAIRPSQSAKGVSQVWTVHLPPTQAPAPLSTLQGTLHAPQWARV